MSPTYEYYCDRCEGKTEIVHGIKESPVVRCLKCRKPMRRLISGGAGVIFKGEGFYETDYKKKENRDK